MLDQVIPMTFVAMLLAGGVVARGETPAPLLLDDFEDGSDSGWRVVGHGPAMGDYSKRLVSPGSQSAYAVGLVKRAPGGWCGLAAPDVTRLGLRQCEGI